MKGRNLLICFCSFFSTLMAEPPRRPPIEMLDGYTMNGTIPMLDRYIDGSCQEDPNSYFYSQQEIDEYIAKVKRKEDNYYGATDTWLYQALEEYPIVEKDVLIIGSFQPWYESVVLAYGGRPTTVEYNKIVTDDNRLTVMTVEEFNKNPQKYDLILSISSIEHDGLGRYGDPLNPIADLEFMATCKQKYLKENGHMILAVPIGEDCIVWNAHRIYGHRRLPLLINGWDIVATFGFNETDLSRHLGECDHQPIFYLSYKKKN